MSRARTPSPIDVDSWREMERAIFKCMSVALDARYAMNASPRAVYLHPWDLAEILKADKTARLIRFAGEFHELCGVKVIQHEGCNLGVLEVEFGTLPRPVRIHYKWAEPCSWCGGLMPLTFEPVARAMHMDCLLERSATREGGQS